MRDAAIAIIREIGVETGGSNIQFAINPANGRMIAIEMNPRVSPLQRPGLQGDRLSHRQDRRQAGRRLPARRAAQRHHPRDAGLLRADHRLRRHQGAALDLREVPRRRPDADDADEIGRRDDGHRPDVQGDRCKRPCAAWRRAASAWAATAHDRWGTPRPADAGRDHRQAGHAERRAHLVHPLRLQGRHVGRGHPPARPKIDPWFLHNIRDIVDVRGRAARLPEPGGGRRRPAAARPSSTASPTASWRTSGTPTSARSAASARRKGIEAVVQARRHLRRRVRGVHAVLLLDLRSAASVDRSDRRCRCERSTIRDRGRRLAATIVEDETKPPVRQRPHHDPRRRPQPHRPGDRVRLLLLPGRLRPARGRATRPSWSTRTRRRSRPTTTPAIICSSSR